MEANNPAITEQLLGKQWSLKKNIKEAGLGRKMVKIMIKRKELSQITNTIAATKKKIKN